MPLQDLDLQAKMLLDEVSRIKNAPDDKSVNQLKEEAITRILGNVAEEARRKALYEEIYSVGKTPEEAVRALAKKECWAEISAISKLEDGDPKYTWGRQFVADGVGMKAAGWEVPGGVVLTWWK